MKFIPQKPTVLKKQYRWKKSPLLLWGSMQSFHTVILLSVLITVGCLFYLWQWMDFRQTAFQVQVLEKERKQIVQELDLLKVEVDFLMRPQRLEAIAFQQMQMYYPNPSKQLILSQEPQKNAGVP